MGKPIQDDYSNALLDADTDKIYSLSVVTRSEDKNGKKHFIKMELDIGYDTLKELILSKFEAKKIKWKEYLTPTDEEKEEAKRDGKSARGTWAPWAGNY